MFSSYGGVAGEARSSTVAMAIAITSAFIVARLTSWLSRETFVLELDEDSIVRR